MVFRSYSLLYYFVCEVANTYILFIILSYCKSTAKSSQNLCLNSQKTHLLNGVIYVHALNRAQILQTVKLSIAHVQQTGSWYSVALKPGPGTQYRSETIE